MGALTSKVYPFVIRSWELEKIESIDFFDSFGSLIYIEKRDVEILRIIPRKYQGYEWITDKIRFFFDSLKYQRLLNPLYLNRKLQRYVPLTWKNLYFFFKSYIILSLKKKKYYNIQYIIDDFIDLKELNEIKNFIYNLSDLSNIIINNIFNNNLLLNNDTINNIVLDRNELLKSKYLIYIGGDLRLEMPLLFIIINNQIKINKLKLFIFGYVYYLNILYTSLGFSFKDLYLFNLYKTIKIKKDDINFFIFYGSIIYNNINYSIIYTQLKKQYNKLKKKYAIEYNEIIVYNNLSYLNFSILGDSFIKLTNNFLLNNKIKNYNLFLNFYLNEEIKIKYKLNNKLYLNLFLGSHFDLKEIFDFKLPIPYIYERNSLIFNIFEEYTLVKYIYFPIIKNEIKLLIFYLFFIKELFIKKKRLNELKAFYGFYYLNIKNFINMKFDRILNKIVFLKKNKNDFKTVIYENNNVLYKIYNAKFLNKYYQYYNFNLSTRLSPTLQLLSKSNLILY